MRAGARDAGLTSVHSERFSSLPVVDGAPFVLELARTGAVVSVAADETALTAVRRAVGSVAYSCQQGFCGTCPVRVLAGTVEHRDRCLTPLERESAMAICCGRGWTGLKAEWVNGSGHASPSQPQAGRRHRELGA